MNYKYQNNKIIFKNNNDFNPEHVFECGQAFRWRKEDDESYTVVAFGRVINVSLDKDNVVIKNTSEEDFNSIWINYFDLNTDYNEIKNKLSDNGTLNKAMKFGYGIRILNQEKFETTISFIISANNQIPRIKKSIEILSENYGKFIENYNGVDYFSFPTPEDLAKISVEEIREVSRVGFRDKRISEVSNLISKKEFDLEVLKDYSSDNLKKELMTLPGIGPKVASCIMLFAYDRGETFPIDVWIKRVMEELYIGEETNIKLIGKYAEDIFGDLAGYAQQYLFYYGRENDIGKTK